MNRFRGATSWSAPSKASPSTQCQKCLKRGHYSFECKASLADRPYISRPSRTQQFFNPSAQQQLITPTAPTEDKAKTGIADEILANKEKERSSKRRRESPSVSPPKRHTRSSSTSSVSSYSSISSGRSPSPVYRSRTQKTQSPDRRVRRRYKDSPSPPQRGRRLSADSGRRRSRSPSPSLGRRRSRNPQNRAKTTRKQQYEARQRSLSPFSRRAALTKAMRPPN